MPCLGETEQPVEPNNMLRSDVIDDFLRYENRLSEILARFTDTAEGPSIRRDDEGRYRQYIIEIVDLLNDSMSSGKDYSNQIGRIHAEGIQNYLGSPSLHSVETILGVLRALITRISRKPELLDLTDPNPVRETSPQQIPSQRGTGREVRRTRIEGFGSAAFNNAAFNAAVFNAPGAVAFGFAEANISTSSDEIYERLLVRITALEERLAVSAPGGLIGHNNPPEPIEGHPLDVDIADIKQELATLRNIDLSSSSSTVVEESATRLAAIGIKLVEYCDLFGRAAVESAGKELGKKVVSVSAWLLLGYAVSGVAQQAFVLAKSLMQ